jgi:SNF2 family DNA or RNA helicase
MGAGCTSQVTVYKLITEGTVDESIYKVQSAKRERTEALLGKDDQHGR